MSAHYFIVKLADKGDGMDRYYWNELHRHIPNRERWCFSSLAAFKFLDREAAEKEVREAGFTGFTVEEVKK